MAIPGYSQYEAGVDYEILEKISEGGAGDVFIASLKNMNLKIEAGGSTCVVKILKSKLLENVFFALINWTDA